MGSDVNKALDQVKEVFGVIGDQARDHLGPVGDVIHAVTGVVEDAVKGTKMVNEVLMGENPLVKEEDRIFSSNARGIYVPASSQDVTVGFQNYLNSLLKISPLYVARYGTDELRERYVDTVTVKEKQAARDQVQIHKQRRPFLANQERRLRNA
jgi:hypothetical protein